MRRRDGRPVRGQALTEFAFVLPIFLLVLYSIIEFGRYVYVAQVMNNAAREGARYAITHGSLSLCPSGPMPGLATNACDPYGIKVQDVVRNFAVGVAGANVAFPAQSGCAGGVANPCWPVDNARGANVTVVAQTLFTTLLPIPLPPITVDGSSTLVINH